MNSVKGSTKAQGFSLNLHDLPGDCRNTGLQPYKYIGKELDRTHGLDWYDHGARHYDPITGRWNTMDPMCEKYYGTSPYASCGDDPVKYVDNDGKIIRVPKSAQRNQVLGYINSIAQGVWDINKKGELYLATESSPNRGSQIYKDKLKGIVDSQRDIVDIFIQSKESNNEEKAKEINQKLLNCREGYISGKIYEDDEGFCHGLTIYISGNSCIVEDGNGTPIEDDPAMILCHEIVGHAAPAILGRDTGNAIDNENKVRKELGFPLRKRKTGHGE